MNANNISLYWNAMIREVRIDPEKYLESNKCSRSVALAEWAAWNVGQDICLSGWLDDDTHFIRDLAIEVGDLYALNRNTDHLHPTYRSDYSY